MKRKNRILLGGFVFVFLLGAYGMLVEPNFLQTRELSPSVTGVPKPQGVRVVFFADLHMGKWRGFHERLLQRIADVKPSLILFGGDALSRFTDVSDLKRFFSALSEICPVYAIFGNWEEYAPVHMRKRYEELDVNLLEMESTVVHVDGMRIGLTGLESHQFFPRTTFLSPDVPTDYRILLVHAPNHLEQYPEVLDGFDLVLSGHTHGGQLFFPGLSRWISETAQGTSYTFFRGAYRLGHTGIFVTKGVGQWFPFRLFSAPELCWFTL
ncbi:MAG TPA: metallophosphoesterase [Thermotogota bacterium]|nr:metallophosphoesterase [Thermotogota bacterium]HRW91463.1 metallophosphoesterase [Thermotogota bacterium]